MRPGETFGHVTDAPVGVELEPGPPPEIPRSPRAIAWTRRRLSARRVWVLYRKNTMGMIGLITLIFFIAVAVFAPVRFTRKVSFASNFASCVTSIVICPVVMPASIWIDAVSAT